MCLSCARPGLCKGEGEAEEEQLALVPEVLGWEGGRGRLEEESAPVSSECGRVP